MTLSITATAVLFELAKAMPTPVSLVIAHSKELIRAGLRTMLATSPVTIVGEATHVVGTRSLVEKLKPDVLLVDTALPGGDCFDFLRGLRKAFPATKCVVLSALENPTHVARALVVGASQFLLKSVTQKELVTAIVNAAASKGPAAVRPFTECAAAMGKRTEMIATGRKLTSREVQVLAHLAYGLSNHEIAHSVSISLDTVKEHVHHLFRKLGVHDRTQAAVWALKAGVV